MNKGDSAVAEVNVRHILSEGLVGLLSIDPPYPMFVLSCTLNKVVHRQVQAQEAIPLVETAIASCSDAILRGNDRVRVAAELGSTEPIPSMC